MERHNITIDQGSTYLLGLDLTTNSGPIDLSNATLRGQLRTSYDAASAAASFTAAIVNASAGQATLTLSAAVTAGLAAGVYVYDVELDLGGAVTRLIGGRATVTPEVTK